MRKTLQKLAVSSLFATLVGCGTLPQKGPVAASTPEPTPAPLAVRAVVIPTSTAETDATGRYVNAGFITVGGATLGEKPVVTEYVYRREDAAFGMPDGAILALAHYRHYLGQRDVHIEGIVIDSKTLTLVDEYNCVAPAGGTTAGAASKAFLLQVPDVNAPPPVVVLGAGHLNRLCSHSKTDLVTDQDRQRTPRTAVTASP